MKHFIYVNILQNFRIDINILKKKSFDIDIDVSRMTLSILICPYQYCLKSPYQYFQEFHYQYPYPYFHDCSYQYGYLYQHFQNCSDRFQYFPGGPY